MACVKSWCISNTLFLLSKGPAAVCLVDGAAPGLLATDDVDEEESDNTSTEALPFWYGSGLVGLGGGYTEPPWCGPSFIDDDVVEVGVGDTDVGCRTGVLSKADEFFIGTAGTRGLE